MSNNRQNDDLESFTFRMPGWLKNHVMRIKNTLSIPTMSDAARVVMEKGANELVGTLADARELVELQRHEQSALQKIVAKYQQNELLSRSELTFVAQQAHQAYMLTGTTNVRRGPLLSNLESLRSVLRLRSKQHQGSAKSESLDRYYLGNLGNYGDTTFEERLDNVISTMSEFPSRGQAEFASRCLEVALSDEPVFPIERLNSTLKPQLPSLIKLALRGYLCSNNGTPAMPLEPSFSGKPIALKHPTSVTKGSMYVGPHILGDSMTAAISWEKGNVIVSVNSFLELSELLILVGAAPGNNQVSGSRFTIISPMQHPKSYILRLAGVQISFADGEFDDMRGALEEAMQQQVMVSEYDRLAWVYGDV